MDTHTVTVDRATLETIMQRMAEMQERITYLETLLWPDESARP